MFGHCCFYWCIHSSKEKATTKWVIYSILVTFSSVCVVPADISSFHHIAPTINRKKYKCARGIKNSNSMAIVWLSKMCVRRWGARCDTICVRLIICTVYIHQQNYTSRTTTLLDITSISFLVLILSGIFQQKQKFIVDHIYNETWCIAPTIKSELLLYSTFLKKCIHRARGQLFFRYKQFSGAFGSIEAHVRSASLYRQRCIIQFIVLLGTKFHSAANNINNMFSAAAVYI